MVTGLQSVKSYIIAEVEKIDKDPLFISDLDSFLQRLIDDTEGSLSKDLLMTKAGRQLLCCIGIDIKSGLVPITHFLLIFRSLNLTSFATQARHLFIKAIIDNKLYYRECEKLVTDDYRIVVFPIADRDYYIDGKLAGIHGLSTAELIVDTLVDYLKLHTITCKNKLLYKGTDLGHYWTTVLAEINNIKSSSGFPGRDTVDRLGLSHFTFRKEDETYFCYFDIGTVPIETYRPNATLVNWSWPEGGFMSYIKDHAGRTFSITGYANYKNGIKERIFNRHLLSDIEQSNTRILVFEDKIDPPIIVNTDELILEGLERFNLA